MTLPPKCNVYFQRTEITHSHLFDERQKIEEDDFQKHDTVFSEDIFTFSRI